MSNQAEAALSSFKAPPQGDEAWKQYKLLVDRHGICTGGVLGELWDDLNMQMLGKQWQALRRSDGEEGRRRSGEEERHEAVQGPGGR
jgi:hypothetical protein